MTNEITLATNELPAHLQGKMGIGRGNEDVAGHVTIPRLKLLQKMSDEVDPHHSKYVEGAKAGDFLNSLTGENYGSAVYTISITFKNQWQAWRSREAGGGYGGTFSSAAAANEYIQTQEKPEDWEVIETHTHLLLLKDPETGQTESTPVMMDFTSSKLRVSRDWNSLITMKGGDRFAGLWKLSSVTATSKTGNSWMNVATEFVGWAQEEDYKAAEALYETQNQS